jgi:hypothetical protein
MSHADSLLVAFFALAVPYRQIRRRAYEADIARAGSPPIAQQPRMSRPSSLALATGPEAAMNVRPTRDQQRPKDRRDRRRPRTAAASQRRRTLRRRRFLVFASIVILGLTPVWISLGSALENPGLGTSIGARFAEWAREHGGGLGREPLVLPSPASGRWHTAEGGDSTPSELGANFQFAFSSTPVPPAGTASNQAARQPGDPWRRSLAPCRSKGRWAAGRL